MLTNYLFVDENVLPRAVVDIVLVFLFLLLQNRGEIVKYFFYNLRLQVNKQPMGDSVFNKFIIGTVFSKSLKIYLVSNESFFWNGGQEITIYSH